MRINVTADNLIGDARINEIRVYDQEGISSFPKKSQKEGFLSKWSWNYIFVWIL